MADVSTTCAPGASRSPLPGPGCAVRFFLAGALSPRVQANGRWIGVNARHRKAYAISGKEPGSPLLAMLAAGEASSDGAANQAAVQLGLGESLPDPGYLVWFRALNEGYPFLDYSKSATQVVDAELMGAYAAAEPPPVATTWSGGRLALPEGRLAQGSDAQAPSLELMAAWLRLAAGATHLVPIRHSVATYKTSPSGGARHPTDIGIGVGAAWPDALRGGGWYDGVAHDLAPGETAPAVPAAAAADPRSVVFTISSHVRRAMWRYRDPRAIRPVAIDAGHVVETLIALIGASGWRAWWEPTPGFTRAGGDLDPVFGYVLAAPAGPPPARGPSSSLVREARGAGSLRSNPLFSLVPGGSRILAENHLAPGPPLAVSPGMIDALAWSTPSSRNDRPTRAEDLIDRYVSPEELDALVASGLLLDLDDGDILWRSAKPWFDHDWYLSLLAFACEVDDSAPAPPLEATANAGSQLSRALDLRRTARSFSGDPPPPERAAIVLDQLREMAIGLDVILTVFSRFGTLGKGVYRVSPDEVVLMAVPLPSDEQVRAAAIGQPWARNFGAIIWLVPRGAGERGEWIGAFVEAGRCAQRLALGLCDLAEVGIFQSPALVDQILPGLIGDAAATDGAYMIGLGTVREHVEGGTRADSRKFLPSDLIVTRAPTP